MGYTKRLRAHARGGVPPLQRLGRFEDGAPAPHEHLAGDAPGGFALTLAGECPLCGAERLEDGAPAPRECLRRRGFRP